MRIAVLTSGGDAPGMNAAIRSVTRTALARGWEVRGVRNGYAGLLAGDLFPLGSRDVGGVIQRGGTLLGSSRCPGMKTEAGSREAADALERHAVEALVVIGGNGSQRGAEALFQLGVPVVGVASTIDNDLYGADVTLGVDSALGIALEAIDRLKTTASSHRRAFLVEVMGRDCGYLALMAGIAGGAEAVVVPEVEMHPETVAAELQAAYERGKKHALVVVAEGARCDAAGLARYFETHGDRLGFELRATILGHVQRGGAPSAFDRILGTRMGAAATDRIAAGETGVLVGLRDGRMAATPLPEAAERQKTLDPELLELARVLAR